MKCVYDVIIRPVITEQSMEDLDIKKFAFEVAKDATKIEVKKAVEEIFGVTVVKVTPRPSTASRCAPAATPPALRRPGRKPLSS